MEDGADGRRNSADTMINHHHLIFDIVARCTWRGRRYGRRRRGKRGCIIIVITIVIAIVITIIIVLNAPGDVGDMEGEDAGEEREVAGKFRLRRVSPRPPRSWEMRW